MKVDAFDKYGKVCLADGEYALVSMRWFRRKILDVSGLM